MKPNNSPCIGQCNLRHSDHCSGCGRTGYEIKNWARFDAPTQLQVRRLAKARLTQGEEEC